MTLNFDIPFPVVGLKFKHKYWKDKFNTPQTYVISAMVNGVIYIRAEDEEKAKEFTCLNRWSKVYGGPVEIA